MTGETPEVRSDKRSRKRRKRINSNSNSNSNRFSSSRIIEIIIALISFNGLRVTLVTSIESMG